MPQAVLVLQCGNCQTHQGQLAKTTASWTCKICNQKQPLNNVLFEGTGKQCREKVQQLNMQRGIEETQRICDVHQQDENILRMKLEDEHAEDSKPQHY
ncbi:hypothetical protein RvY_08234 [Ramazzottius varieornatus]|uniref:MRN complex-interacting protein N-terminal domain-containing protein n=1 Tax=Ramazzottius varieornatus TaxID=947166 RepID=A0A1D1VEB4_RAMVA|nr:hypothetical protein RvY_08234 [Ramazzottius varieornatus]